MGLQLFETQPVFKQTLERCAAILDKILNKPLVEIIFHSSRDEGFANWQPALFAFEYALAELWKSWGVIPNYVMGHSAGEYVAATVAGVLNLEDGLKLITARASLMQTLPKGGIMVAIMADVDNIRDCLTQTQASVDIAAINSPTQTVISGKEEEIDKVISYYEGKDIKITRLNIPLGAHSRLVQPILEEFGKVVATFTYRKPEIPIISNLTGELRVIHRCRVLDEAFKSSSEFFEGN